VRDSQIQPGGLTAKDFAVAAGMNVLWGLNIIAVKMAVDLIAPLTAALLRQVIVLLVCITALKIIRGKMLALSVLGLLSGCVFYVAVNLSLAISDNVSALAIAGQLGVPFSLILAVIVFRERIRWPRILGISLSFAGVALLAFDPSAARELPGLALTAIASAIWACTSLIQRSLRGVPVLTIYAWVGFWGTIGLLPIALHWEPEAMRNLGSIPLSALAWIAFSAIGSTVAGQGSMSWLLQRHPVNLVTPLTLAAPVVSVVAAAYWFGTPVTWLMAAGGGIAMLGVSIVALRSARRAE
jgi:O-acetylserine/cysteine efflux transporter